MRYGKERRLFCWTLLCFHLQSVLSRDVPPNDSFTQSSHDNPLYKDLHGLFSPRMDYDQWKPLGRGDPLKNDPTYDYVPPVLDRVHYWIDPALRKPDPPVPGENQKTEILLLGVSSKKPSTGTSLADSRKDPYDSFLKFVDGPKFNSQRNTRPLYPMTSSSYFSPPFYSKNKVPASQGSDQRMPYTVLMPPPVITSKPGAVSPAAAQKPDGFHTTTTVDSVTATTTLSPVTSTAPTSKTDSQVTVQAANLVYHSSSLSSINEWKQNTETSTNLTPNPVAYSTKKLKPFKEDVVFQKHLQLPESYMQIQFSPTRLNLTNQPLVAANSDSKINFVTPPPLMEKEIMHKGQVSDDNLDISNTYVKIGKTEAQVHSTAIDNIPVLPSDVLIEQSANMMPFSPMQYPLMTQTPLTLQTLQSMQSMQPPPVTTSPVYKKSTNPIRQALEKEKTTQEVTTERSETTTLPSYMTTVPATTTTTPLTTDPLFKHYKQPAESKKAPLYLIIQGHSKVKTYGPSKQIHGISVQETNEISDDKEEVSLKHLHNYLKNENNQANSREARSGNLQTLKHVIQTRLGAIDFGDVQAERKKDEGVKETELQFGYKVGDDVTSETYHKGIVEEARKLYMEA